MLSHQLTLASYIHELYESSTQTKTYANYGLVMTDKMLQKALLGRGPVPERTGSGPVSQGEG